MRRRVRSTLAVALVLALSTMGVVHTAADEATTLPVARPLTDRRFEPTPARVERGRYLAEHLLQCFICHSERDWSRPGAPPVEGRKGAGAIYSERGDRRVVAPNLTPDPDTGAGRWSDDMLARAIREGIGHDGRALHPSMWYGSFAGLADEDLAGLVVYLRTLAPVRNALPPTTLPAGERAEIASMPAPITAPVAGPPEGDVLAYGRYLLRVADCAGCHTSWYSSRNPGEYAGGNEIVRGERSAFSSNITSHPSGAGYPADAFIALLRTGKGGAMSPLMPWIAFKGLSDADLGAMHSALSTTHPVAHFIANHGEPRHCAVCGQAHPLGGQNRIELPGRIELEPASLARLTGAYRSDRYDLTLTVRVVGTRIYVEEDGVPSTELLPQSPTFFLAPGDVAPYEFVLDADGRAQTLISRGLDPIELERMH